MPFGNAALQDLVTPIYTTTGAAAIGFDSLAGLRPSALTLVSAASAVTLTLPPAALTNTALGAGDGQKYTFVNLAAQAVSIVANGSDSILGASTTIAQNASASYVADSVNNRYIRLGA